jgi:hypothetical protein
MNGTPSRRDPRDPRLPMGRFPSPCPAVWVLACPSRRPTWPTWPMISPGSWEYDATHMLHGAGIFTYICPNNHPNVGKYTIHGAYDAIWCWICLWTMLVKYGCERWKPGLIGCFIIIKTSRRDLIGMMRIVRTIPKSSRTVQVSELFLIHPDFHLGRERECGQ